jgi:hypothetical protein
VGAKKGNTAGGAESTSELISNKNRLLALMDRAQEGDEGALPALRKVLDEEPKIAMFVDLARDVERSVVKRLAGNDMFTQEAIPRNLKAMRREIAGDNPSPLEKLLTERIALCWLELQYFEAIHAQNLGNISITQSDHHQRRIDKAHRRYLSSIKALAQIRKMGPTVQINIAEQQINTAG